MEIKNRLFYDEVDLDELYDKTQKGSGQQIALDCIREYEKTLQARNTIDFAMLESLFLEKLKNSELKEFLDEIRISFGYCLRHCGDRTVDLLADYNHFVLPPI